MQTDNLEYLLPDFITGKLGDEEAQQIRHRIDTDTAFEREFVRMSRTMGSLDRNKRTTETPPAVHYLLVGINARIDAGKTSVFDRLLKPRILVPLAIVLQVFTVFIILSINTREDVLPDLMTQEIQSTLEDVEITELLALENSIGEDMMLPDLVLTNEAYTIESNMESDVSAEIHNQIFSDNSYEDVLSASEYYLSDEELVQSMHESTVAKILEQANDKSLL